MAKHDKHAQTNAKKTNKQTKEHTSRPAYICRKCDRWIGVMVEGGQARADRCTAVFSVIQWPALFTSHTTSDPPPNIERGRFPFLCFHLLLLLTLCHQCMREVDWHSRRGSIKGSLTYRSLQWFTHRLIEWFPFISVGLKSLLTLFRAVHFFY